MCPTDVATRGTRLHVFRWRAAQLSDAIVECIVVGGLILVNGFFAMAELAIVSSRKARLRASADAGNESADLALGLAEDPTQFLSTIQVGMTLVGVLASAYGGATLAGRLTKVLVPVLGDYAHDASFAIVVAAITFASVVVGELVPKRLALAHPESIAMGLSHTLMLVTRVLAPIVYVLSAVTDAVFRVAHVRKPSGPPVTDEEIKELMEQGAEAGHFLEEEAEIVALALRLGDRRVASLMTARASIDYLDVLDPEAVTRRKITHSLHSRFPLTQGGLDQVIGVVQAKDLLATRVAQGALDLRSAAQEAPFVPETAEALKALELLKRSGAPVVMVVGDGGVVTGMLTPNDLLEALIGDIDVHDTIEIPVEIRR